MSAIDDLKAECDALGEFVMALGEAAWARPTIFHGWTTYDEIVHNHYLDLLAMMSLTEPARFADVGREVMTRSRTDPDYSFRVQTNIVLGTLSRDEALARWQATYNEMCELFASRDPEERMAWFGPPMSVTSCALARQMEVWAHGQDIYDLFGIRRRNTNRIGNIALLGVKTFGWSFANRGLPVPAAKPYLALTAPDGEVWTYNDPAAPCRITGPAEDFSLVATQRRHVADTRLVVTGADAQQWLEIAQCFAGDPADGPAPGQRLVTYADGTRG